MATWVQFVFLYFTFLQLCMDHSGMQVLWKPHGLEIYGSEQEVGAKQVLGVNKSFFATFSSTRRRGRNLANKRMKEFHILNLMVRILHPKNMI